MSTTAGVGVLVVAAHLRDIDPSHELPETLVLARPQHPGSLPRWGAETSGLVRPGSPQRVAAATCPPPGRRACPPLAGAIYDIRQ